MNPIVLKIESREIDGDTLFTRYHFERDGQAVSDLDAIREGFTVPAEHAQLLLMVTQQIVLMGVGMATAAGSESLSE